MNLHLLFLSLAIFICWGFIGYVIVDLLGAEYVSGRRWLLAPAAGMAFSTVCANLASRLGFPARTFGWPLLGALLAASAIYWVIRRPRIDWWRAAPWMAVLLGALALVAWPLVVAGTDWVSVGSGDMTNYVIGASHFYDHGYYQLPATHELLSETDPSWDSSFQYSYGEIRSATQLMLAWFMALSGLVGAQGYMILMAACHLVVVTSAAALVYTDRSRHTVALAALVVVASSANLALGTFIQLMPQDFGLALLGACATVLFAPLPSGAELRRRAVLAGLFVAALLIAYPELSSFVGVTLGAYCAIAVLQRRLDVRRWLVFFGLGGATTIAFASFSFPGALHFLYWNLVYSSHASNDINLLFPYYLTPLGLAQGWGLVPQGTTDFSSWQVQLAAVVGALLFAFALVRTFRDAWRLEAAAVLAATMLLLFIPLFAIKNGFGLYKLAMYAQPFVLAALTIAVADLLTARAPLQKPLAQS